MIIKKLLPVLTTVFLVMVLLTDLNYKYFIYTNETPIRLTMACKLIIGFVLGTLFFKKLKENKKVIIGVLTLVISCALGYLKLKNLDSFSIYIISQYGFGIIVILAFLKGNIPINTQYIYNTLYVIIIFNFICIAGGWLLDIHVLETYKGNRFGYNGIFKGTSTASYFYMFSLVLFTIKQTNKQLNNIILSILIISSLFVGSKTLYFFIVLYLGVILMWKISKRISKKHLKKLYIISSTIIFSLCVLVFMIIVTKNERLALVLENHGLVSAIFSYRDIHLVNAYNDVINNYEFINFCFGGLYSVNRLTEIALADIFITFGIIGTISYVFILNTVRPKIHELRIKILLFGILAMIFLRGNFFYFPSVIYISMIIFSLIITEDHNKPLTFNL